MSYTAPLLANGTPYDASLWQAALDEIQRLSALSASVWTSYTPTWRSSGTQPAVGNGTLQAWYKLDSTTVTAVWRLLAGSTTTYGTGAYFFDLPLTASANTALAAVGSAYLLDSGTLDKPGSVKFEDVTKLTVIATTGGPASGTNPHTMAVNDQIRGGVIYERA